MQSVQLEIQGSIDALEHSRADIPVAAIGELSKRGALSNERIEKLKQDVSVQVREAGYRALVRKGVAVAPGEVWKALESPEHPGFYGIPRIDAESVIRDLYETYTLEQLEVAVEWVSSDGHIAYGVLAQRHFADMGDRVRKDLHDKFQSVRDKFFETIRAKHGPDGVIVIGSQLSNTFEDYVRARFMRSALGAIATCGKPEDILIGRSFLDDADSDVAGEAIRVIERFGGAEDVPRLVELAREGYGSLQLRAAVAALHLDPGLGAAAKSLLETLKGPLVELAVRAIWDLQQADATDLVFPGLASAETRTRMAGTAYLALRCPRSEAKGILRRYLSRDTYYYDVVCWFDRVLYAPEPLRSFYRRELCAKVNPDGQ